MLRLGWWGSQTGGACVNSIHDNILFGGHRHAPEVGIRCNDLRSLFFRTWLSGLLPCDSSMERTFVTHKLKWTPLNRQKLTCAPP
jgi:hypothetical protein